MEKRHSLLLVWRGCRESEKSGEKEKFHQGGEKAQLEPTVFHVGGRGPSIVKVR